MVALRLDQDPAARPALDVTITRQLPTDDTTSSTATVVNVADDPADIQRLEDAVISALALVSVTAQRGDKTHGLSFSPFRRASL